MYESALEAREAKETGDSTYPPSSILSRSVTIDSEECVSRPQQSAPANNGGDLERLFGSHKNIGFLRWDSHTKRLNGSGGLWRKVGIDQPKWQYSLNSLSELFCFIHPDDEYTFFSRFKQVRKRSLFQIAVKVVTIVEKVQPIWLTISSTGRSNSHVKVNILGIAMDAFPQLGISDQVKLGAYRHLLNKATIGTYHWMINDNQIHSYPSCWKSIGFSEKEIGSLAKSELVKRWIGRVHPDDYVDVRKTMQFALLERKPFTLLYRVADRQQRYRWVQSEDQAIFNAEGELIALVGTVFDREKERSQAIYLEEQIRLLHEANQMESERLHQLSAHINTPMNTILGYSQWFDLQSGLPSKQRERINLIKNAGEHLLQLINNVIDLSKMEAGQLTLNYSQVNVTQLIRECLALCQPVLYRRRIRVITHFRDQDVWQVIGDRLRLKQVFLNLISNASKYNDDNGWIRIRVVYKHSQFLSMIVEDGGWGMSEEQLSQLFQPYNRLGAEATSEEGSGLGLAISKKLINCMGGEISCSSQEGVGSSFTVSLRQGNDEETLIQGDHNFSTPIEPSVSNGKNLPPRCFSLEEMANVSSSQGNYLRKRTNTNEQPLELSERVAAYDWPIKQCNRLLDETTVDPFDNCTSVKNILYIDKCHKYSRLIEQWVESFSDIKLIPVDSLQLALFEVRDKKIDAVLIDLDSFFSGEADVIEVEADRSFYHLLKSNFLEKEWVDNMPILALSTIQSEALSQDEMPELKGIISEVLYKPLDMKVFFESLKGYLV